MTDLVINILSSATVAGLLSSALIFLARNWISERLRQSIQHEYAQKLETYRALLKAEHDIALERLRTDAAQARAIQDVATGSFLDSRRAGHQRRLQAIEELWRATLKIRESIPSIVMLQDVLLPEEYPQIFTGEKFSGSLAEITYERITSSMTDACRDVESNRPFVGEYLWWLFFIYRAIMGRFCVLILFGKENRDIVHWSKDGGVRQLLEAALTSHELTEIYKTSIGGFDKIQKIIETKMLNAANRIVSGKEASQLGLEQAQKIATAAAEINLQNRGV